MDKPLKYRNLDEMQKFWFDVHLANGCGPKGGMFNPPEFLFHASCNHHDFNYWKGGTEEDRNAADRKFYEAMQKDAARSPWYSRWWHTLMARVYYLAVAKAGKKFFSYGDAKTWEDLEVEIKRVQEDVVRKQDSA